MSTETTAHINWPRLWKRWLITYLTLALVFSLIDCWPQIKQSFAGQVPPWPQWWERVAIISRVTVLPLIVLAVRYYEEHERVKKLQADTASSADAR